MEGATPMDATTLTELEKSVLDALLAGDHPILTALREQVREARIGNRTMTGVGLFSDIDIDSGVDAAPTTRSEVRIGDVFAEMEGLDHGAGFVLLVEEGRLAQLEGYTFDSPGRPRFARSGSSTQATKETSRRWNCDQTVSG